jgi:hypothetical protein
MPATAKPLYAFEFANMSNPPQGSRAFTCLPTVSVAIARGTELLIFINHAITLRGRSEDVWPWLVQLGWQRAGWYTYRRVDRLLFPANMPSTNSILPEHQNLKLGDHVPDGAPETGVHFVVEMLEPHKLLVLGSDSHLPPWPTNGRLNWAYCPSPCHEQLDRGRRDDLSNVTFRGRKREGMKSKLSLTLDSQRLPRGDHDLERRRHHQRRHLCCRIHHLLEVVQDQHHLLGREIVPEGLDQAPARRLPER